MNLEDIGVIFKRYKQIYASEGIKHTQSAMVAILDF
jgi:hypothetical protein